MLRRFFIALSESGWVRSLAEHSSAGRKLSQRFVAGTEAEDVLRVTGELNQAGLSVSIDHLGENVTSSAQARASAAVYSRLLDEIASLQIHANISLKLTHMGLDVDPDLAYELVAALVSKASGMQPRDFVRVDMEGSAYTARTIDFVRKLHAISANKGCVGAVVQAYMHRSEADIEKLLADGIRIRLCKGAYREPPQIAFQRKSEVDANYIRLMKILLKSGIYHGIATHDTKIIRAAQTFATQENIPRESFEFQMLYGIRRDLQRKLAREGWGMRVYVPFGMEWYPYLMRRLAERPANVLFLAKNLLRG